MTEYASLVLKVDSTQAKSASSDLDGLTDSSKKAESNLAVLKSGAAAVGVAIAAAATAAIAMTKANIDAADAAGESAAAAGISVEQYTRLGYAMKFSVGGADALDGSMKFLNKSMYDAANGSKSAQAAFDSLGVSYTNADGSLRESTDVMLDVADKFSTMKDGAQKSAMAMDIFGKSGAEMVPFLNQGAAGINELTAQADRLGVTLDGPTADAAGQFNDNIDMLKGAAKGFGNEVMKGLLPSLNNLGNEMVATADNGDAMASAAEGVVAILKGVVTVGVTAAATVQAVGNAIGGVAAATDAALSGDFSGAADIMKQVHADTVDTASATMSKIAAIWDTSATAVEAAEERKRTAVHATMLATGGAGAPAPVAPSGAATPGKEAKEKKAGAGPADNFDYGASGLNFNALDSMAAEEAASAQAYSAARMERLTTQFQTEREAEILRYTQEQEDFRFYAEQKLLTQDEINRRELEMKSAHDANMLAAGEMTNKAMALSALGSAESIFGAFASRSKTMFKLQKAAGIAQGLVSIQTGIANAMSLPWPLNLAAAANVAVTGAGIMSKLKSMNDSGGGSIGLGGGGSISPGGMASTSPSVAQSAPVRQQTTDIRLTGIRPDDMISGSYLQKIIEGIGETLADNGGRMGRVELVTA